MDSDTSDNSIHKIVYLNNTALIYVEDPDIISDAATFGTDRELLHSSNNSGDMNKMIKKYKDIHDSPDSSYLNNNLNIDTKGNSYADSTVSMTRQQTLSEKSVNVK